jgi:hypothetical protein
MGLLRKIGNRFGFCRSPLAAIFALSVAVPISAQADDWSGFPTLVLGLLLIPGSIIALFIVGLAFVRNLRGWLYVASTVLFLPVAWYGFGFFAGQTELASEGRSVVYFLAIFLLAMSVVAYCTITVKYWRRYLFIRPRHE